MSEFVGPLLRQLSGEIMDLVSHVIGSTGTVEGQTREFGEGFGSGWMVDPVHLVTNYHVIEVLEPPITVRFTRRRPLTADLLGVDPHTDLAVLRVDGWSGSPLRLRVEPEPRLGELCFAFGSPLGLFPDSVSSGVISGLRRRLPSPGGRTIEDVVQTDAAINPGNSGGPLVDVDGRVIGVNTAGVEGGENMGFAVPAYTVSDIVGEIVEFGAVERPSLGVSVATRVHEAPQGTYERLTITGVRATASGSFEVGDVLLRVDGKDVQGRADLFRALRRDLVGRRVTVEVWRAGAQETLTCVPQRMEG